MPRPNFTTRHFEASHQKAPRGHGCWAFCDERKAGAQDYLAHAVFSPAMTYAEAKKWAAAQPQLQHTQTIAVLP
jgi:hypothetical protein